MNKEELVLSFFKHRVGVLATMHHKEKVISPLLEEKLGINIVVPSNFNTDRFGTFTRDIDRVGSQLEAAKQKAEQAMSMTGHTLGFASEGVFGPHPFIPFMPVNREIVLLIDKENKLELFGETATTDTNYNHKEIKSFQEAYDFCMLVGFPEHGVVVSLNNSTKNPVEIVKGIINVEHLKETVEFMLKKSTKGEVFIETDMRAMYNPTRMKTIGMATNNLIEKIYNLCPSCSYPGFELTERKKGLLCSWCGHPTDLTLSEIYSCKKCGVSEEKLYPKGIQKAEPSNCPHCNP